MQEVAVERTAADLLRDAAAELAASGVSTPRLDAEVLLGAALGVSRAGLYARLPDVPPGEAAVRFAAAMRRRARREPVAYITGVREFWSLPFAVTPAVLIPRPETELLVEAVRATGARAVCELGTGSGCIAVAVARELPAANVVATDCSVEALTVARRNAATFGVGPRVRFVAGDLFAALDPEARFDAVVSNPPYVPETAVLAPELGWEPAGALRGGSDGLAVIRRLVAEAPARLRKNGWLIVEFGDGQAETVRALAEAAGFESVRLQPDLAGVPRVLVARRGRRR